MSFIDFLVGWYSGWGLNRDSVVHIQLIMGNETVDKRAATLGAESRDALGSLTVWDTGELEVEVMDLHTMKHTLHESITVEDPEDFATRLAKFIGASEFVKADEASVSLSG